MTWWKEILLVGTGGFVGSVFRYALSGLVHRITPSDSFPAGTLVVNVTGCLAIGLLGGLSESRQFINPQFRLLVFIGILGAFTTFSTFGYETLTLVRDADYARALINVSLHLALALGAVWLGLSLARSW